MQETLARESDPLVKAALDVEERKRLEPLLLRGRDEAIRALETTQLNGSKEQEQMALELVRRLQTMAHMRFLLVADAHVGEVTLKTAENNDG